MKTKHTRRRRRGEELDFAGRRRKTRSRISLRGIFLVERIPDRVKHTRAPSTRMQIADKSIGSSIRTGRPSREICGCFQFNRTLSLDWQHFAAICRRKSFFPSLPTARILRQTSLKQLNYAKFVRFGRGQAESSGRMKKFEEIAASSSGFIVSEQLFPLVDGGGISSF